MLQCLEIHEEHPWLALVQTPTNALAGAGVSWLCIQTATGLQSGGISAVANLVATIFAAIFGDQKNEDDEDQIAAYFGCQIIATPLVALGASLALGWSISIPAVLLLTVTNVITTILGTLVFVGIQEACYPPAYI